MDLAPPLVRPGFGSRRQGATLVGGAGGLVAHGSPQSRARLFAEPEGAAMVGSVAVLAAAPPLTWGTGLTSWQWAYGWDAAVVVAAIGYALGLRRLWQHHRQWPLWRAACFACGLVVLVLAVNSGIAVYSTSFFSVHMAQHLMLIMVVPYLLIAGHPLTLWVNGAPAGGSGHRRRILRSRPVSVITNPGLAFVFYGLVLAGTHLTPFLQVMLLHPWLHQMEIGLYLLAGYLCFLPVLGFEPITWRRFPIPLRLVLLMIGMLPDTGIGVVLMTADHVLAPAFGLARGASNPSLLADQRLGGAIMWVAGDGLMALALVVLAGYWTMATGPEAGLGRWLESARRHALTHADASGAPGFSEADVDSDERALAHYNAMLAELAGLRSESAETPSVSTSTDNPHRHRGNGNTPRAG